MASDVVFPSHPTPLLWTCFIWHATQSSEPILSGEHGADVFELKVCRLVVDRDSEDQICFRSGCPYISK